MPRAFVVLIAEWNISIGLLQRPRLHERSAVGGGLLAGENGARKFEGIFERPIGCGAVCHTIIGFPLHVVAEPAQRNDCIVLLVRRYDGVSQPSTDE